MAVRHGYGKIAGTDALVFAYDTGDTRNSYRGEPTVNILSSYVNPTFENGSKSADGWTIDPKTNGSYEYYSADSYSGNYSIKLTNSTVSDIAFWRVDIPVVSGVQYTVSVYAKNINCPTTPYFSGVNISGGAHSFTGISTTEWKRFTKTYTASSTGNAQFYIRTSNDATQGSFLIDNFQIEQKSHATPFVNGTRSATQGLLDLTGNSSIDLTNVSFDSNAQPTWDGTNDSVTAPHNSSTDITGAEITLEAVFKPDSFGTAEAIIHKDLQYTLAFYPDGAYGEVTYADSSLWNYGNFGFHGVFLTGNYYHIVATKKNGVVTIYSNSEIVISKSFGGSITSTSNSLYIGSYVTSYYSDGVLPVVKLYNRALTADEVRNNYRHYKTRFNI